MMLLLLLSGLCYAGEKPLDTNEVSVPWTVATSGTATPWVSQFQDEALNEVVAMALRNNRQLQGRRAQYAQSKAGILQATDPLLPTISLDGSLQAQPQTAVGFQFGGGSPGAPEPQNDLFLSGSASINARLAIDLFGKQVLNRSATRLDAQAVEFDVQSAAQNTAVRVVEGWFDIRTSLIQLELLGEQSRTQHELLDLLETRFERSESSALDVLQQRQSTATTDAFVFQAQTILQTKRAELAYLLAVPLSELPEVKNAPLPNTMPDVQLPNAQMLANQRPELQAAARRYRAAKARKNATWRGMLPVINASASAGYQGTHAVDWSTQSYWNVGVQVSQPLFSMAAYGALRQAQAAEHMSVSQNDDALFAALQQIQSAVARDEQTAKRAEVVGEALIAAEQAYGVARQRYLTGLVPFINVNTTFNAFQRAQVDDLNVHREQISARVQLLNAIGSSPTGHIQ